MTPASRCLFSIRSTTPPIRDRGAGVLRRPFPTRSAFLTPPAALPTDDRPPWRVFLLFLGPRVVGNVLPALWERSTASSSTAPSTQNSATQDWLPPIRFSSRMTAQYQLAGDEQIVARFMIEQLNFRGIVTAQDAATCLASYDRTLYPETSGPAFTQFFCPLAWDAGLRLEHSAADLWNAFVQAHAAAQLSGAIEIQMDYFTRAVETILISAPLPSAPIFWNPGTSSDSSVLLRDAELVLRSLPRQKRSRLGLRPQTLTALARSFNAHRWRLKVEARQQEALVLLLCIMYWRGCRHPVALDSAPCTHPPPSCDGCRASRCNARSTTAGRSWKHSSTRWHESTNLPRSSFVACCQSAVRPRSGLALLPDLLKAVEPHRHRRGRPAVLSSAVGARLADPAVAAFQARHAHALVLRIDARDAGVVEVGLGVSRDGSGGEQGDEGKALHGRLLWSGECILRAPP